MYNKTLIYKKIVSSILLVCFLLPSFSWAQQGKQYRIGTDDIIEIRFWQDPSLNAEVRVGLDGMISLDVVGQIQAANKTTEELQSDIIRQMSRLDKNISQVVVRVVQFNYNHVFVTGQVNLPGKRTFEEIPDLWTIINEAGGVAELGDLSRVTIIRGGEEAGKVEVVNVSDAIARNQIKNLPKIRRMDTIEIPRNVAQLPTSTDLSASMDAKNLIYVVGAVNKPGPIAYDDNIDVLDALALAGGPTPTADLKKTRVISKDGPYTQTLRINLEKQWEENTLARYILKREDTFVVPEKKGGFLGLSLANASIILGIVTSTVILIDRFSADNNGSEPGRIR